MKAIRIILFTLLIPICAFAELSDTEKKIAAEAEAFKEEAIALLQKVADINSGTLNVEGVRQVGDIFQQEFDAIGFETTWIDMPPEMRRAGHLFAEHEGTGGNRLLLIGHLDTVFEKDSPWQPFEIQGSIAKGQGVVDDKGGDIVMLYALKALQRAGVLENRQIIVALTGDEEMAGDPTSISRKDLIEAGKRSDIALGFESAIGMDTGTVARRGIGSWKLTVKGKQAHSAGVFSAEDGDGAVYESARILEEFRKTLSLEKYLTFNPGIIAGGTEVKYDETQSLATAYGKQNIIAQNTIVEGDLRFLSTEQKENARKKMTAIVSQKNLPHTSAAIEFTDGYPAMSPTKGNYALLKMLDQTSRDLGLGPVHAFDPGGRGAGDISWVASEVDCLDGLGAMGEGAHAPGEEVDLNSLTPLIQRAAILIYRLTSAP